MKMQPLLCSFLKCATVFLTLASATAFALTTPPTGAIAAGVTHTIVLKSDGTVWTWGNNSNGQLGDGTTTNTTTAVPVSGLNGVVEIAAGNYHSMALRSDGTVWTWGENWYGELGDSTTNPRTTPVQVIGLSGVISVATHYDHNLALKDDGTVWAWGNNYFGQLGDGTTTNRATAVQVSGLSGVTAIATGQLFSMALKSDGTVWTFGCNTSGQLGDGTASAQTTAVKVSGLSGVIAVAIGNAHSMAIKSDGTVWAWGNNSSGQLGDGTTVDRYTPVPVNGLSAVGAVTAGSNYTVALRSDGTVWTWGNNSSGQLGAGTASDIQATAVQVNGLVGIVRLAAGDLHTLALQGNGTIRTWGSNYYGQLGDGKTINRASVAQVSTLSGVTALTAGQYFSVALKTDGTVWAWGDNSGGQLGDGTTISRTTVQPVGGLSGVVAVAAGSNYAFAIKNDGTAWAWGYNLQGQLGDGTTGQQNTPVQVSGLGGVVAMAAGYAHTVALKNDGTVWAWGYNGQGRLGDGTFANRLAAVRVSGLSNIVAVQAGNDHTIALKSDGTVWAWGSNYYGQLGDGTTTNRTIPVLVSGLTGIVAITTGADYTLSLKNDGTLWAWGYNGYGQLGDGTTTNRTTAVRVNGLSGIVRTSAGLLHTIALKNDGTAWAWGLNDRGQLGDGTVTQRLTAVSAAGLNNSVSIETGGYHTLALKSDGTILGLGDNSYGQLSISANRLSQAAVRLINWADDMDQDGMSDTWEIQYFGNLVHNGSIDTDSDGLTDIQEFANGSDPTHANIDGDGLTDFVDLYPNDYYNNITPSLLVVSGDNQIAPPNSFNSQPLDVAVWNATATVPLSNAPVTFAVTSGEGYLATTLNGPLLSNLTVRADQDGTAPVFFKHGSSFGVSSAITVTAGNAQLLMHSTTGNPQSQTIMFADPGPQTFGSPFSLSATASSGLPVTFAATSGPVSIANGIATFTGTGSVTITAKQSGNGAYSAAPDVTRTFDVSPGNQPTVTLSPPNSSVSVGDTITFTASGGINSYVWGDSASGSGTTKSVTFNSVGTFNVSVYAQAGGNYAQSNTATAVVTVLAITPPVNTAPFTPNGNYQMVSGYENGDPIVFSLFQNFDDAQTPDADLHYTVAVAQPQLFTSVTIDAQTGLLTLTGAPNQYGSCQCIVTAEDPEGLKTELYLYVNLMWVNTVPVVSGFGLETSGDPLPFTKDIFDAHCVDESLFQSLRFETVPSAGTIVSKLPRFDVNTKSLYPGAGSMMRGDFDGDRDSDVVIGTTNDFFLAWYENTGGGNFVTHTIASARLTSITVGDFDHDGDLDFAGLEPGTTSNVVWWRNDGASPRVFTRIVIETIPFSSLGFGCLSADINGDGALDLITSSFQSLQIYVNNGAAAPTFNRSTVGGTGVLLRAVCDVDGDGDVDLISSDNSGGGWSIWNNIGGNFARRNYAIPYGSGMYYVGDMSPADLDGDGDLDLAINFSDSNQGNSVGWEEQIADGGFTHHRITPRDFGIGQVYLLAVHDIDADGDKDLLVAYPSLSDSTRWYETIGVPTDQTWNLLPESSSAIVALRTGGNPTGDLLSLRTFYDGRQTQSILTVLTRSQMLPLKAGDEVNRKEIDRLVYLPEQPGVFPFSWTVSDGIDRSNVAITTIQVAPPVVLDTTPPVITVPESITIEATSAAGASVTFAASATDLVDGPVAVFFTPASGSTFSLGTNTVTLTATDASGNTATSTFTITVRDTTAPVITVPTEQTLEATGPTGAVTTFSASATDLVDGAVTESYSIASGSTFPLGMNTVTVTATDAAGNTVTNTFIVTVRDTTAPVITTPDTITVEATSAAGAAVTLIGSATDLVDGSVSVNFSPTSESLFPLGETIATATATDAAGNTATTSVLVKVVDTVAPVLSLPTDLTAEASGPAGVVVTFAAQATDTVNGDLIVSYSAESGSIFALGETIVTVTAIDTAGNVITGNFKITVRDTTAPTIVVPANQTLEATGPSGASSTYSVSATDLIDGVVSVSVSSASGSTFALGVNMVTATATDAAGNTSSRTFTVTVRDSTAPVLMLTGDQILAAESASGAAATFAASATDLVGVETITYSNASGSTFPIGRTVVTVTATDAAGNASTGTFSVTVVNTALAITSQPLSQAVAVGSSVTFSVVATGTGPISYQWKFGTASIAGATGSSYTIPAAQTANAGSYKVVLTNAVGTVTSATATLSVKIPPAITTQPVNLTVTAGKNATFKVVASGSATLSYRWYFNGSAIPGATKSTYTITAAQSANVGSYSATVINAVGSVSSVAVTLRVNYPVVITSQPASQSITLGTPVTFNVNASGTDPLNYQWRLGGVAIAGATSSSYSIPAAQTSNAGNYSVMVTNVVGTVTSATAVLKVNTPPVITAQPIGKSVTSGTSVTFRVVATGTATLTYQWQKNGGPISGATAASYVVVANATTVGTYTVVVSSIAGTVTSSAAVLTLK